MTHHRIGLVVPSSNVTVETEMPRLLARHPDAGFSFHASRMRLHSVSEEELRAMNAQRGRCVDEIADAGVDAVLYACLVALMAQGAGEHTRTETLVRQQFHERGLDPVVASSAGALVTALRALDARRIGLVMPYLAPIARLVVDYLATEGFDVVAWTALEVGDNAQVGCIPGEQVRSAARGLHLSGADALVLSACVQMPSLDLVTDAEQELGMPVLSAATAGAFTLLDGLGLPVDLPGAGSLLARDRAVAATTTH
ncbi:maleate cis-trans isomerase [Pseudonocardia sp. KRD-184]|uniref:Maleate isomerase n=1 Tax=Pseudonocardia oceani TaxID=2792013 RepID=A0ABS6UB76_9PSEU|nr:maleate cis-trans isomerase [Pseudonocardia oceani]MBW0091664.1 maleate cis-trans isomerase [Pseudonocardia oceani]MBW0094585.1 maleate cis-trans isomerase [Pseudonocardia oceani]MBW0107975.1 maleate cis-trans isomerase [Pseudonocardia oceani]MBW0119925.1 maleate cis-trans isomerase [Pseudonocardia oceani]MBW0129488.1 maleate cis-trans isomerase [Pseudonocardia oceani]